MAVIQEGLQVTVVDSTGTELSDPIAHVLKVSGGGGGGGGAATIADGADVVEGSLADVAVSGDNAGTVSAKLRGLNKTVSTEATLALIKAKTDNLDVALSTRTKPADTQTVSGTVTANAGTNLNTSALALEAGNLATIAGKDFSTQTTLALVKAKTDNLDVALSTRTKPADQQHTIIDSGSATVTQGTAAASTAGWPVTLGGPTTATATWTSATALDSTVAMATTGYGSALITLLGAGTITGGQANFELSNDGGTTWYVAMATVGSSGASATIVIFTGVTKQFYYLPIAGATNFRVRLNPVVTGTGNLVVTVTANAGHMPMSSVTGSVTAIQGTTASLANAWAVKPTDGTTAITVKAASTASVATDTAEVVALSPNSNVPMTAAGTALASASRGVATVNTDIVVLSGKGIRVWQDLTVLGASSVCQFSIQEKDPASGKFITLLASAATGAGINSTGTAKLTIYPGLTAAANSIASDVVPVNVRIVSTVTVAASTFSQGYSIIP